MMSTRPHPSPLLSGEGATLANLRRAIHAAADPVRATHALRFFRTGKGEYGEGDRFLGLTVPMCRALVKEYYALPLSEALTLLHSSYHDERQIALLILAHQVAKGDAATRQTIVRTYLTNTRFVNNWDLVDCSAYTILGAQCVAEKNWGILKVFARSEMLWERRIAIVATYAFIRNGQYAPTITIARTLLRDDHDLIHKAVGWMLREVGKRDERTLTAFLDRHAQVMPRTTLRYAIERLTIQQRTHYLSYGKSH